MRFRALPLALLVLVATGATERLKPTREAIAKRSKLLAELLHERWKDRESEQKLRSRPKAANRARKPVWASAPARVATPVFLKGKATSGNLVTDTSKALQNRDRDPLARQTLNDRLFSDPKAARETQYEVERRMRAYEEARGRHAAQPVLESQHNESMSGLARSHLSALPGQKLDQAKREVENSPGVKSLMRDQNLMAVAKPALVAAAAVAIYNGQPIEFAPEPGWQLSARAIGREERGSLSVGSPFGETTVAFSNRAPTIRNPFTTVYADSALNEERVNLSVRKPLPVWDLAAGLAYGTSTRSVVGSLSREIAPHLVGTYGLSRNVEFQTVDGRSSEQFIRLDYGVHF